MAETVFEILLKVVKKQLEEVEEVRANVRMGSENESKLKKAYDLFNTIVIALLKSDLNKVSIQRDLKKGHQHLLIVTVPNDGFKFRIPASIIANDRELSQKVKEKMENIQIVNSTVMSLRNPAQPMDWEEYDSLRYGIRYDLEKRILEVLGATEYPYNGFISLVRASGLALDEIVVLEGTLSQKGLVKLKRISPQSFKYFLVHTFTVIPTKLRFF